MISSKIIAFKYSQINIKITYQFKLINNKFKSYGLTISLYLSLVLGCCRCLRKSWSIRPIFFILRRNCKILFFDAFPCVCHLAKAIALSKPYSIYLKFFLEVFTQIHCSNKKVDCFWEHQAACNTLSGLIFFVFSTAKISTNEKHNPGILQLKVRIMELSQ